VTPDRNDQTHADDGENEQNGVLSDTESLATAGFGFLGGQTEQVSVVLPSNDEDDLADDDVIDDEVAFVEHSHIEHDHSEHSHIEHDHSEPNHIEHGHIESGEADVAESPVEWAQPEQWTDAGSVYDSTPVIEDAAVVDDDPVEDAAEGDDDAIEDFVVDDDARDADDQQEVSVAAEEPAAQDAAPRFPLAPPLPPRTDQTPTTGSVPSTRWEAQHPDVQERPDPARAVERVIPRADVTMTSKRLGEFEAGRETADLLTADRLLDPHQVVRPEPEGAWQQLVYSLSGHRINLGDGKRARARKELDRRIAAPLNGSARFVPVLSRKGGVGKTTVTTLLGMALADARDDRIIAVDANPDRGTLAERISRASGKTVRDLVKIRSEVTGYNDISNIVARDETRLDVLASDSDPRVSEALNDRDYHDVASLAAHYYSIVLTDTGTGIVHSVMGATLDLADQLVVVTGLSVDEARLASETLTWLETNGYSEQVRNAVVVLNNSRPGSPLVRQDELEGHFRTRVRTVVRVPYDPHIAAGSAISFRDLRPATRLAARDLAASVVEGLRAHSTAA
jgi:MinD-like ATPase involved in chromosome partitioning or flagellar assembly